MSSGDNFLQVSPGELTFKFEPRKNIPIVMTLTNSGKERVAFKVKTTSPKKYCVRPSSGFVEPNSTKEVQVIMQASREPPVSYADCKDKFLVQCVKVAGGISEVTSDLFDLTKARDIRQSKLRVVLIPPAKPPSPVPEGNESSEPPSPADFASAQKDKFDARMNKLETPTRAGGQVQKASGPRASLALISILLVALLAFIVGQYGEVVLPLVQEKFAQLQHAVEGLLKK